MAELLTNSGIPDQTSRSVASDLGLHCLPITLLGVSGLQLIKQKRVLFQTNVLRSKFICELTQSFFYFVLTTMVNCEIILVTKEPQNP